VGGEAPEALELGAADARLGDEAAGHVATRYKLELKAKDRTVAYDRVVYRVRSDGTFFPVRAEYHTISGRMLKALTLTEVARLGGRARPTLLTMESALEPGSRTSLRFLAIEDEVKLDDRMFTPSALERGE
jgi:hypothetical protein